MKILSYLSFIVGAGAFVVGALSLWFNSRAWPNRVLALLALSYTIYEAGMTVASGSPDLEISLLAFQIAIAAAVFHAPLIGWLCILWGGASRTIQAAFLAVALVAAVLFLVDALNSGFYFSAFVDGPWGNRGVPDPEKAPWIYAATLSSNGADILFASAFLLFVRVKTTSGRMKRQLNLLLASLGMTFVLYFVITGFQGLWEGPNLESLAGAPLFLAFFWLILKYRYLRPDTPLLESHLASVIADAAVLLDPSGRIAGANAPACDQLGHKETDAVGRDFSTLLDDPSGFAQDWSNAQAARPIHKSFPVRMGGRTFTLSLSPRYHVHGDFAGAVVFLRPLAHWDTRIQALELTPRERDILLMLLECRSNADIADRLGTAEGTVKRHLHNILEKTATASRAELLTRLLAPNPQPGR